MQEKVNSFLLFASWLWLWLTGFCFVAEKNCSAVHQNLKKESNIFIDIALESNCSFLPYINRKQLQSIAYHVLHGEFHFKVGKPLGRANRYEIKMVAKTYPGKVFKLDDFLMTPYLPFKTRSAHFPIYPSYFSKSLAIHQGVEKVTSSNWPPNTLPSNSRFQHYFESSIVGKKLRKLSKYISLIFDR